MIEKKFHKECHLLWRLREKLQNWNRKISKLYFLTYKAYRTLRMILSSDLTPKAMNKSLKGSNSKLLKQFLN